MFLQYWMRKEAQLEHRCGKVEQSHRLVWQMAISKLSPYLEWLLYQIWLLCFKWPWVRIRGSEILGPRSPNLCWSMCLVAHSLPSLDGMLSTYQICWRHSRGPSLSSCSGMCLELSAIERQDCLIFERVSGRPQNSNCPIQGIVWWPDMPAPIFTTDTCSL